MEQYPEKDIIVVQETTTPIILEVTQVVGPAAESNLELE